jgi:serine/threonine-protein kinase
MIEESIAHYRITDKIGQGGMGEVYRATDTKLNRDVAIKVLPESFAEDRDRMARFSREAQVLASLNHPNIASIHGLEESEGKRALVMELVEGETLADRLKRGPIPLEEALAIAKQIAEALEEAHENGFIHRDLKPANVKVTPKGTVKVLDFGLAKALEGEAGGGSSPDLSQSPTLSAAATAAGVILGTAAYMSPEQARGQAVDRRGDIWSFGVLFLEMLVGKPVYSGETVSDVLARVLEREPDWSSLPADTPPGIRRLLRRCLQKAPRKRLQSIGDARLVIEEYLEDPQAATQDVISAPAPVALPPWRRALPWAVAGLMTLVFALALLLLWPGAPTSQPIVRLNAEVSSGNLFSDIGSAVVLSPDGERLAYVAADGATRQLHIRSLDRLEGASLSGTEGAYHPFFSPDGKWVGFVTRTELKKVSISGGAPLTLCDVNLSRGASWGPDDTIVFASTPGGGLSQVPAAGGEPKPLTELAEGEATHRWPQILPGGGVVLFTSHSSTNNFDDANVEVVVLDTGERKVLHRGGSYARYVPSGHLVYVREGTLFAAPFDLRRLELTGSPAPILEGVISGPYHGAAQFDTSQTGLLVYLGGSLDRLQYSMVRVDRDGRTIPVSPERKTYGEPHLSPDGSRLAVQIHETDGTNVDIWVYDLKRGASTRLTFDEAADVVPIWSPDGKRIAFTSDRNGTLNLYWKRADGSGDVERLTESENTQWVSSFSPDGRYLVFHETLPGNASDIFVLPLDGDRKPELFLGTPFSEAEAAFSPDGRWIAYESNESGSSEIYVRPFPAGAGKWQVSTDSGNYPRWSRQARELFYRKDDGLMVVQYATDGESFIAETPRKLLDGPFLSVAVGGMTLADYDVDPGGKHFVMMQGDEQAQDTKVTFVFNWFEDLRRTFAGR